MTKRSTRPKMLYRSEKDRMIAGIAGGLGEFFKIDSSLIRLLFVVFTIPGGMGLWIYLFLWVILPSESSAKKRSEQYIQENVEELKVKVGKFAEETNLADEKSIKPVIGVIIILIGAVFLMANFGFSPWVFIWRFWPLILIASGLYFLFRKDE